MAELEVARESRARFQGCFLFQQSSVRGSCIRHNPQHHSIVLLTFALTCSWTGSCLQLGSSHRVQPLTWQRSGLWEHSESLGPYQPHPWAIGALRGGASSDSDKKADDEDMSDGEVSQGGIENPWEYFTRKPLAEGDMIQEILTLVTDCQKVSQIKKGANEVTKAINRNIAEFVVIGADTEPIEMVLHLPMLCEDKGVPYVWLPKREELGKAVSMNYRSVTAVAVLVNDYSTVKDRVVAMRTRVDLMRGED